jgi:MFS family permease
MSLDIDPTAARLHLLCAFFALGPFVWGYNIGILASIFVHPGFQEVLDQPSPSQKGLITAVYYLGTWISYLFMSHIACDRFGRRYAAFSGMFVACIGTAFLAAASGPPLRALAMVIIGRILGGLGIAVVSTSVPMYQRWANPPLNFVLPILKCLQRNSTTFAAWQIRGYESCWLSCRSGYCILVRPSPLLLTVR